MGLFDGRTGGGEAGSTAELAKLVKPAHFEVMKGLGHFPMSENPPLFRSFILPVLEEIAGKG